MVDCCCCCGVVFFVVVVVVVNCLACVDECPNMPDGNGSVTASDGPTMSGSIVVEEAALALMIAIKKKNIFAMVKVGVKWALILAL